MIGWAQIGCGVFALPVASVLLGLVAVRALRARRVVGYTVLCGLVAFLVDVYLY